MLHVWYIVHIVFGLFLPFSSGVEEVCGPKAGSPLVIHARPNEKGFIYSPGFLKNQNYSNLITCSYYIQTTPGWKIRLQFNQVEIQDSEFCQTDSLTIYDFKHGAEGEFIFRVCGKMIPNDYLSIGSAIQVDFLSDFIVNARGFNITYITQSNSALCPNGKKECRNRNCVSLSGVCNGKDDCGDGSDEEKCGHPIPTVNCGISSIPPLQEVSVDRVVGGIEAVSGSWPWMVSIQDSRVSPTSHFCGGTLINPQWILTAAHCFQELRTSDLIRVHLGKHKKFLFEKHEQIRRVERLIIYGFSEDEFIRDGEFDIVHDIALLKLNAPVLITQRTTPACLPNSGQEVYPGTSCYAIGWGATRGTGNFDSLKQARHPVQDNSVCAQLVDDFRPETMICAGSLQPLQGVCHGDSGGPLLCQISGRWNVMGVASFVTDGNLIEGLCGLPNRPSVFNKVHKKRNYIWDTINRYSS